MFAYEKKYKGNHFWNGDVVKVLKFFTNVETVIRDFSFIYKNAISEALPNAKQIVDRFYI